MLYARINIFILFRAQHLQMKRKGVVSFIKTIFSNRRYFQILLGEMISICLQVFEYVYNFLTTDMGTSQTRSKNTMFN